MKRLSQLQADQQIEFYDKLLSLLPAYVDCKQSKTASGVNFLPAEQAIHSYKFIRYNVKNWVTILVFDIDNISGDLGKWHSDIKNTLGIEPSYTLKTDNGIQFGIFLDGLEWIRHQDKSKTTNHFRISTLKKIIADKLGGSVDHKGSDRLLGMWRNPVTHETIVSKNIYSLTQLSKHFKLLMPVDAHPKEQTLLKSSPIHRNYENSNNYHTKMRISPTGKVQKEINKGFCVGNRNNYLYHFGYKILFEDRSKSKTLETILQNENSNQHDPLQRYEVTNIAKSILDKECTMYQVTGKPRPEAKHRQYMYDKNIQGLYNRQAFGGWNTAKERRDKTGYTVINQLVKLFESGVITPSNKQVVDGLEIKTRQWQRVKRKTSIKKVFTYWLTKLMSRAKQIGSRAYDILFKNDTYFGIGKSIKKVILPDGIIKYYTRSRISWQNVQVSDISPLKMI